MGKESRPKIKINAVAEQLQNTLPKEAEFTFEVGLKGAAMLTHDGYEYNLARKPKDVGRISWMCRYRKGPLCKGCIGALSVCWKSGKVISAREHSHPSNVGKKVISSMGTSDSIIRYSKSLRGAPVLHYQGYEYTKHREKNAKYQWRCRQRIAKKCKGYLLTNTSGILISQVAEHSHLPININPQEKEQDNTMTSPLFL